MSRFPSLSLGLARAARFGQRSAFVVGCALGVASVLAAPGCGGSARDPFGDARHLRVGLDPSAEADAIEERLIEDGFVRAARVDAPNAVGLAMRDEGGRSVLRIVTRRGVVLAVAAPTEALTRSEVGLVEAPADLDGDGHVELIAAATDAATERRCLALVRVLEDGGLAEVTPELRALGGEPCLEALSDLDADGRFEVVAVTRFGALAWGSAPRVPVVFVPFPNEATEGAVPGARWQALSGDRATRFFQRERAEREAALRTARGEANVAGAYRLGVELAAIARHAGADTDTQIGVLRSAADGLTLGVAASERWLEAVEYVRRGWRTEAEAEAMAEESEVVAEAEGDDATE
ncbi:MAG: hypothetical protein H6724_04810 [Sandaracinus sp.]|nr:hypothetical protein [Sandaracinus sp.]